MEMGPQAIEQYEDGSKNCLTEMRRPSKIKSKIIPDTLCQHCNSSKNVSNTWSVSKNHFVVVLFRSIFDDI